MNCYAYTTVLGCYNDGANPPRTVTFHYIFDAPDTNPAVKITELDGTMIAGADMTNTTPGACALIPPDVEFEVLCDIQANSDIVRFARRKIITFDAAGVPTVAVADFEMDYTTPYTVTGDVGPCSVCPELPERGFLNP